MSNLPHIRLLTPSLAPHDAIGNDIAEMHRALLECGYTADLIAEGIHPHYAESALPLSSIPGAAWRSTEDILIYHHSTGWPAGENVLLKTANKVVIRYHNITPPHYFAPYSAPLEHACARGLQSTRRLAGCRGAMILGDSTFNCEDFKALGIPAQDCRVLAPFHLTEELGRECFDIPTLQRYSGDVANLLFVGGVKPHKGHARAVRVFAEYRRHFNNHARLIFAGGIDERLQNYVDEVKQLAADLGLIDSVVFTGPVTASQIKSLYGSADVFLCTSEHEGFCVPLVEAMYFRVPIVAWGVTAIPETLGQCGFLLGEWNEFHCASLIAKLVNNKTLSSHFGDLGRERYQERFSHDVLRSKLEIIIGEVESGANRETVQRGAYA